VIDVVDNGVGIPPEQRAIVFDMFHRVSGQSFSGTGLGLAIVKKIVSRHGGAVWVDAGPEGAGTTMHVRLAAAESEEAAS
jgi:signal transduction histidine kinase